MTRSLERLPSRVAAPKGVAAWRLVATYGYAARWISSFIG
jgi:hypothetical protein